MAAPFKNLQRLVVLSNTLSLECPRNLHNLQTLQSTGCSNSTEEEASSILRSLEYLDTIVVYDIKSLLPQAVMSHLSDPSSHSDAESSQGNRESSRIQHRSLGVYLGPRDRSTVGPHQLSRYLNLHSNGPLDLDVIKAILQFTASSRLTGIRLYLSSATSLS
ncbi:uncharacterized protein RCO7_14689 [Rhynchosporium graminicola]|uniref:Uncharacterized protein n=1 Tax=Rhynchosporium graminicola TaxID=2792576 RepID=A0A1E1KW28_9HELO|nr:uncharacterized protein RCO7_14689 [Rhynchosporium commune]